MLAYTEEKNTHQLTKLEHGWQITQKYYVHVKSSKGGICMVVM